MKTVNDFIRDLQSINESKRNLPIQIVCPNGIHVSPNIKMRIKDGTFMTKEMEVEAIIVTWQD